MKKLVFLLIVVSIVQRIQASNDIETSLTNLSDNLFNGIEIPANSTVAVLPFESSDSDEGKAVAEYIVVNLQMNSNITLVDRINFSKTMSEISLAQTGVVNEEHAVSAGKALSAKYIVAGSIKDALGKKIIQANLIEVETSKIMASAKVVLIPNELANFSKELLGEKGKISSSVFRSTLIPGWGQFYTNNKTRGLVSLIACLGSGVATIVSGVTTVSANNEYKEYHNYMWTPDMINDLNTYITQEGITYAEGVEIYEKRESDKYDEYTKKSKRTLILGAVTGGLWTLNIIDAIIAGKHSKNKFDLYFSSNIQMHSIQLSYKF